MARPRTNPPAPDLRQGAVLLGDWQERLGLTQVAAARRIGIAQGLYSEYRSGRTIPSDDRREQIQVGTQGDVPVSSWTVRVGKTPA